MKFYKIKVAEPPVDGWPNGKSLTELMDAMLSEYPNGLPVLESYPDINTCASFNHLEGTFLLVWDLDLLYDPKKASEQTVVHALGIINEGWTIMASARFDGFRLLSYVNMLPKDEAVKLVYERSRRDRLTLHKNSLVGETFKGKPNEISDPTMGVNTGVLSSYLNGDARVNLSNLKVCANEGRFSYGDYLQVIEESYRGAIPLLRRNGGDSSDAGWWRGGKSGTGYNEEREIGLVRKVRADEQTGVVTGELDLHADFEKPNDWNLLAFYPIIVPNYDRSCGMPKILCFVLADALELVDVNKWPDPALENTALDHLLQYAKYFETNNAAMEETTKVLSTNKNKDP